MKTIGFGEILFDRIDGRDYFGGAPANVSVHLSRMGAESYIISALGNDEKGEEASQILKTENVHLDFLQSRSDKPTGIVEVLVEEGIPEYDIKKNSAWDDIHISDAQLNGLLEQDWDLFFCGTLAQRTTSNKELLGKILSEIKCKHFFFDVNLRKDFFSEQIIRDTISKTTILKMNNEELPVLSELLFGKKLTTKDFISEMSLHFSLELLVLTLGSSGAAIYDIAANDMLFIPAVKVDVVDTVGAGDSFSAAFMYSLLKGENVYEAGENAVNLAAYIASQPGALPPYNFYN